MPSEGLCPKCLGDLVYADTEVDLSNSNANIEVSCPGCGWAGIEVYEISFEEQVEE